MRNKYEGKCYYCGETVAVGDGHFEKSGGGWKVIHSSCVYKQRADKGQPRNKPKRGWVRK